jgi:hypothetical protein
LGAEATYLLGRPLLQPIDLQTINWRKCMRKLIAVTALSLMCGATFAQNTGPAPQTGMEKPGMTNGAKPNGAMDTTGMSPTKGNMKREKDGAPSNKVDKK